MRPFSASALLLLAGCGADVVELRSLKNGLEHYKIEPYQHLEFQCVPKR